MYSSFKRNVYSIGGYGNTQFSRMICHMNAFYLGGRESELLKLAPSPALKLKNTSSIYILFLPNNPTIYRIKAAIC